MNCITVLKAAASAYIGAYKAWHMLTLNDLQKLSDNDYTEAVISNMIRGVGGLDSTLDLACRLGMKIEIDLSANENCAPAYAGGCFDQNGNAVKR